MNKEQIYNIASKHIDELRSKGYHAALGGSAMLYYTEQITREPNDIDIIVYPTYTKRKAFRKKLQYERGLFKINEKEFISYKDALINYIYEDLKIESENNDYDNDIILQIKGEVKVDYLLGETAATADYYLNLKCVGLASVIQARFSYGISHKHIDETLELIRQHNNIDLPF